MTKLLVKNTKILNSANSKETLYNIGIPAYKSKRYNITTCKMAGICGNGGCYAQQAAYSWGNVQNAYENRLGVTLSDQFIDSLSKELTPKEKTAKRQEKQLVIRIHDSGDFYSVEYIRKWLNIMQLFPNVIFYAYTKEVPIFKRLHKNNEIPYNFSTIYSEGGKADRLINTTIDRHARVFPDKESLLLAGYDDASKDDTIAYKSVSGKIGLIYHGYNSKEWSTDQ